MLLMGNTSMRHNYKYPLFTVYFISDQMQAAEITSYEGDTFALTYMTSQPFSDIKIYKDGTFIQSANTFFILNVKIENRGLYHAKCHGVRSKFTSLTVLRKYVTCMHIIHVNLSQRPKIIQRPIYSN